MAGYLPVDTPPGTAPLPLGKAAPPPTGAPPSQGASPKATTKPPKKRSVKKKTPSARPPGMPRSVASR